MSFIPYKADDISSIDFVSGFSREGFFVFKFSISLLGTYGNCGTGGGSSS